MFSIFKKRRRIFKKRKEIPDATGKSSSSGKPADISVSNRVTIPRLSEPFGKKDEEVTGIFIRDGKYNTVIDDGDGLKNLFERLQEDAGGDKARNVATDIIGGNQVKTLTLPGFELIGLGPLLFKPRFEDIEADAWYREAYANADGYIYHIEDPSGSRGEVWEVDRFEIAQILRTPSVVEKPRKPFLLLIERDTVGVEKIDDCGYGFNMDQIVNLMDLGPHVLLTRPFRAIAYDKTRRGVAESGELKEALSWLKSVAGTGGADEVPAIAKNKMDDEGTIKASSNSTPMLDGADEVRAIIESKTDEEGTIETSSSSTSTLNGDTVYVLDYEPSLLGGNRTLQRFEPIKRGTDCPFARSAKLWGGKLADETKPRLYQVDKGQYYDIEEAAILNAKPLAEFVSRSDSGETLDGFCMELPGVQWDEPRILGEAVRYLLTKLAELDPSPGANSMKMGPIDKPHWRFRFAGEDFFITTFSPVYKDNSSRYSFKVEHAFALFQPKKSFGRHKLTEDTPASATNWESPKTMRDKARVAFRQNGRPYYIPENLPYPVAEHVVKPEKDDGKNFIRWWKLDST